MFRVYTLMTWLILSVGLAAHAQFRDEAPGPGPGAPTRPQAFREDDQGFDAPPNASTSATPTADQALANAERERLNQEHYRELSVTVNAAMEQAGAKLSPKVKATVGPLSFFWNPLDTTVMRVFRDLSEKLENLPFRHGSYYTGRHPLYVQFVMADNMGSVFVGGCKLDAYTSRADHNREFIRVRGCSETDHTRFHVRLPFAALVEKGPGGSIVRLRDLSESVLVISNDGLANLLMDPNAFKGRQAGPAGS